MIYLLLILSVFIQTVVVGFNLPILVVIFFASRENLAKRSYIFAFSAGIFSDLVLGNQIGILTASYLIATLIVVAFKSRFRFNALSLLIFFVISQIIFFYARGFIG